MSPFLVLGIFGVVSVFILNIFCREILQHSVDPDQRLIMGLHYLRMFQDGFPGPEIIKDFSCSTQLSMKF